MIKIVSLISCQLAKHKHRLLTQLVFFVFMSELENYIIELERLASEASNGETVRVNRKAAKEWFDSGYKKIQCPNH